MSVISYGRNGQIRVKIKVSQRQVESNQGPFHTACAAYKRGRPGADGFENVSEQLGEARSKKVKVKVSQGQVTSRTSQVKSKSMTPLNFLCYY